MISRRSGALACIIFISIFAIYYYSALIPTLTPCSSQAHPQQPTNAERHKTKTPSKHDTTSPLSPHVLDYFGQVFSLDRPENHDFPALRRQCERTTWPEDNVYLQCGTISAGLTSIMSQVKVCLKMAIEAGAGIILPSMPLRDSTDLTNFNFFNAEAYMTYDKWFDVEHLVTRFKRSCPQMRILHPDLLDSESVHVKNRWNIDFGSAPGYQEFQGYFWSGRPFKDFFDEEYGKLEGLSSLLPHQNYSRKDITVITMPSRFLLFRIMDDPTGQDLELWNDLSHLIRFLEEPRKLVHELLSNLQRPFYGVHFRVESDTI